MGGEVAVVMQSLDNGNKNYLGVVEDDADSGDDFDDDNPKKSAKKHKSKKGKSKKKSKSKGTSKPCKLEKRF